MGSCGTADRRRHRRGDDAATLLHPGRRILHVRRGGDRRAEKQHRTTAYEGVFPSNIALFSTCTYNRLPDLQRSTTSNSNHVES